MVLAGVLAVLAELAELAELAVVLLAVVVLAKGVVEWLMVDG